MSIVMLQLRRSDVGKVFSVFLCEQLNVKKKKKRKENNNKKLSAHSDFVEYWTIFSPSGAKVEAIIRKLICFNVQFSAHYWRVSIQGAHLKSNDADVQIHDVTCGKARRSFLIDFVTRIFPRDVRVCVNKSSYCQYSIQHPPMTSAHVAVCVRCFFFVYFF